MLAYTDAIDRGEPPEVAMTTSMRKITGLERITHHFKDWFNFQAYLTGALHYFIVLIVATLIVSSGKFYGTRAT